MRIAIGSDHGGYELKNKIIEFLKEEGYKVEDFGTHSKESCDYPMIGFEVAKNVSERKVDRGILICKTGIGMAIMANKLTVYGRPHVTIKRWRGHRESTMTAI